MTRQGKLLVTLGVVAALYLLARTDAGETFVTDVLTSGTRGIRNNNPGNIRRSSTVWQGQVGPDQQKDPEFVQFTDPVYGIRAIAKILKAYSGRGLITIRKIISTWAPPGENDTESYIASVSSQTGFPADQPLTLSQIFALVPAIIRHENGSQPYSLSVINRGVSLA